MSMYNLQQCIIKGITAVNSSAIVSFNAPNVTDSFNFKEKITDQARCNGRKHIEIMVPLKQLSNFGDFLKCN